jgi:hypothetical protein
MDNNKSSEAFTEKPVKKRKEDKQNAPEESGIKQRYIYIRKDAQDPTAILIDDLLMRCNQKNEGGIVDFSSLISYSLKLIKDEDISEIQNASLSDEDRVNAAVTEFNNKNGTNYTLYEFVLNGLLKKSKKGVIQ